MKLKEAKDFSVIVAEFPNDALALYAAEGLDTQKYINRQLVSYAESVVRNSHYNGVSPLYVKARYIEDKEDRKRVEVVCITEDIAPPSVVGATIHFPDGELYNLFVDTRCFDEMVNDAVIAKEFRKEYR